LKEFHCEAQVAHGKEKKKGRKTIVLPRFSFFDANYFIKDIRSALQEALIFHYPRDR